MKKIFNLFIYSKNIIFFVFLIIERNFHKIKIISYVKVIKSKILNSKKSICIIYNNNFTNFTYGEYLYSVFLAKYFLIKNKKIKFIIIKGDFYKNKFSQKKIKKFNKDQVEIAKKLLKSKKVKINLIEWNEINLQKLKKNNEILFYNQIIKQKKTYIYYFNLLNHLLKNENKKFIKNVLLNRNIENINKKIKKLKPYIAWHFRYNRVWGSHYNNNFDEFIKIHNYLSNKFKNYKLLIVSDLIGCMKAKQYAKKLKKKLYFSKNYTSSFFEDIQIILNSNFYFQYKAGGMNIIAQFSKIPYEILAMGTPEEIPWSDINYTSWQQKNQKRAWNKINIGMIKDN